MNCDLALFSLATREKTINTFKKIYIHNAKNVAKHVYISQCLEHLKARPGWVLVTGAARGIVIVSSATFILHDK